MEVQISDVAYSRQSLLVYDQNVNNHEHAHSAIVPREDDYIIN